MLALLTYRIIKRDRALLLDMVHSPAKGERQSKRLRWCKAELSEGVDNGRKGL